MRFVITSGTGLREIVDQHPDARSAYKRPTRLPSRDSGSAIVAPCQPAPLLGARTAVASSSAVRSFLWSSSGFVRGQPLETGCAAAPACVGKPSAVSRHKKAPRRGSTGQSARWAGGQEKRAVQLNSTGAALFPDHCAQRCGGISQQLKVATTSLLIKHHSALQRPL